MASFFYLYFCFSHVGRVFLFGAFFQWSLSAEQGLTRLFGQSSKPVPGNCPRVFLHPVCGVWASGSEANWQVAKGASPNVWPSLSHIFLFPLSLIPSKMEREIPGNSHDRIWQMALSSYFSRSLAPLPIAAADGFFFLIAYARVLEGLSFLSFLRICHKKEKRWNTYEEAFVKFGTCIRGCCILFFFCVCFIYEADTMIKLNTGGRFDIFYDIYSSWDVMLYFHHSL